MRKKAKPESQAEQSDRFKKDTQKLIDDGTLDPIEADAILEWILQGGSAKVPPE